MINREELKKFSKLTAALNNWLSRNLEDVNAKFYIDLGTIITELETMCYDMGADLDHWEYLRDLEDGVQEHCKMLQALKGE